MLTAPAHAATQNVAIAEFSFKADRVRIDPGDSVTWTNRGQVFHTVTSRRGAPQSFNSGELDSGQTFTRAFAQAGTYDYVCSLHPDLMAGVVQVGPDRVRPVISRLSARAGKSIRVSFRLSEAARVVARVTRRGRVVRTLTATRARLGTRTLTSKRPLPVGTYRVTVRATDLEGNKAKPASVRLAVR